MPSTKRSAGTSAGGTKKTKITDFFAVQKKVVSVAAPVAEAELFVDQKDIQIEETAAEKAQTDAQAGADESKKDQDDADDDYSAFCARYNFNKEVWVSSLTPEERELLDLEIKYLHVSWLALLHKTLTKPYFLQLKKFLRAQTNKTVFPPPHRIYSWSHLTPVPELKCLILGQDPYHNYNQAHGLAFSVLEPTKPPPSLKNIYKALEMDYRAFKTPDSSKGGGGNLTSWARKGVLLLNTCLTVEVHKPNSHSKQGWETFTQEVINCAIDFHKNKSTGFVVMAWGSPAQHTLARFQTLQSDKFLLLKTFHPSPFSAAKGFFTAQHFRKCNEWLAARNRAQIDWALVPGTSVFE